MPSRSMPILCPLFACLVLTAADTSLAASSNCTALSPLPSVLEVGEGLQQELQSAVAITRLAVGDPKIADVRTTGASGFLLTGMAPGATSLMVWTACSAQSNCARGRSWPSRNPCSGQPPSPAWPRSAMPRPAAARR